MEDLKPLGENAVYCSPEFLEIVKQQMQTPLLNARYEQFDRPYAMTDDGDFTICPNCGHALEISS